MQFMVIETFRNQDAKAVYTRLKERGRSLPEGLTFESSWITADLARCYQIMTCDDVTLLQRWVTEWSDLVEFEIIPVTSGKDTMRAVLDEPRQ
jgi:hypothetical protein